MSFKRYQYALPRHSNGNELVELLRGEGVSLQMQPSTSLERVFHDSFDWRLYRAGLLLFVDHAGRSRRMTLRALDDGLDLVSTEISDDPCFGPDVPEGVMRRRVAPALGERRLLPQSSLLARLRYGHVLDDDGKTVARLCLEHHRVCRDDGAPRRLRDRLALIPVRGYDDWLERLRAIFEERLAWDRLQSPVLDEALTALGRRPLDYRTKPSRDFDPQLPVGEAARRLLSDLFQVIEANEEGIRHDLDVEFLHDLRVAVRRTRVLLGQMKEALATPQFVHYRNEFAWLGAMTGPVRDLDVHLSGYPRYAAWAGERADDLAPLQALLRRERSLERRRLLELLASPRYRNLKSSWRRLLDCEAGPEWTDGDAGIAVSIASAEMVRDRHDKVLKRGARLDAETPDADFHELRKDCKKLRYTMECFAGQFPAEALRPLIKALKGLQDNLGEYQDLCVHRDSLRAYAERLGAEGGAGERAAEAIAAVIDGIEARKRVVHDEFAAAFRHFAEASERKRARTVIEDAGLVASA